MKFLVINGPNMNMLGIREPELYGRKTYADLISMIREECEKQGIGVSFFQSNYEGALVEAVQGAYGNCDGIIMNPAAYTHTSIALLDALRAVAIPMVEVHISDVDAREPFRQISYTGMAAVKIIKGHGPEGYLEAVRFLKEVLEAENAENRGRGD